jgi:phage shock protein C
MKCYLHTDRDAVAACVTCGQAVCQECEVPAGGKHYCKDCLAISTVKPAPAGPKRLSRSVGNRMIMGVCGGLGEYIGLDATIIRIILAVLGIASFGFFVIAYFVAALLIPEAAE